MRTRQLRTYQQEVTFPKLKRIVNLFRFDLSGYVAKVNQVCGIFLGYRSHSVKAGQIAMNMIVQASKAHVLPVSPPCCFSDDTWSETLFTAHSAGTSHSICSPQSVSSGISWAIDF
jgi:hypothetical protein